MTTTDELLERIEELEHEQAQLRQQYEQTKEQYQQVTGLFEQFKTGTISRRAFLTSVTALAGVGFAAGNASAAPDWSAATGYAGTEAQPLIGVNASSVTSELLSTEKVDFSDINAGQTNPLSSAVVIGDEGVEKIVSTTDNVSTSRKTIATATAGSVAGRAGSLTVVGQSDTSNPVRFIDQVLFVGGGGVSVIGSQTRQSPPSRSYSVSAPDVELSMASGTFDVSVVGHVVRQEGENE